MGFIWPFSEIYMMTIWSRWDDAMVPPTYQYCKSVLWDICLNSLSAHQSFTWSASFLICFRDYSKNSPLFLISLPNFLPLLSLLASQICLRTLWCCSISYLTNYVHYRYHKHSLILFYSHRGYVLPHFQDQQLLSSYVLFGMLFQLSSPLLSIFKHHTIPGSILKSFSSTITTSSLDSN